MKDVIIVGAGPGGIQLAYYLMKKKLDILVLEREAIPGAFFKKFPIQRRLISVNKVHTGYQDAGLNMRWDWNSLLSDDHTPLFKEESSDYFAHADCIPSYLNKFCQTHKIPVRYQSLVQSIQKDKTGIFEVETEDEKLSCKALVVATGLFKPHLPQIPGIEHCTPYADLKEKDFSCPNQRVLILGKGNSAFETANQLLGEASLIHLASPNPLKFASRTHHAGHLRSINCEFLDTYQLKSQNAIINAKVKSIATSGKGFLVSFHYAFADDEQEKIYYDKIITCTGFNFDAQIFNFTTKLDKAIDDRFPKQKSNFESTNIKNLFFAGTLTQQRDFKKKQSAFIHGFRYNSRFLADEIALKLCKTPLPSKNIPNNSKILSAQIIQRINTNSSLWQQTGFLCDCYCYDSTTKDWRMHSAIPFDYFMDHMVHSFPFHIVVAMDFGQEIIDKESNIWAIPRVRKEDAANAHKSTQIHPIIKFYSGKKMLAEHHILESFFAEWKEDYHKTPLTEFLEKRIPQEYQRPQTIQGGVQHEHSLH